MKLTNEFLPLQLLKHISERYPNVWKYMEYVHQSNGKDEYPSWPLRLLLQHNKIKICSVSFKQYPTHI